MCERLLRQSICLHSQSPPQKLCVDDESLDSLVLVRTGAAINEGASQPRRSNSLAIFTKVTIYNPYQAGVSQICELSLAGVSKNVTVFLIYNHIWWKENDLLRNRKGFYISTDFD